MKLSSVSLVACIALASLLSPSPNGVAAQDPPPTREAELYEVVEWSFTAETTSPDPFAVEFGATLRHASGQQVTIPGFFDGGNRWVIRFCPDQLGLWDATTYASLPGLAGQTRKLSVNENTRPWQHGPIRVSPDQPQRFVYADGTPYPLMAFELDWLFALDAENAGDIPRTRQIIDVVAGNGFNQIVMNVFAYDAPWGEKEKILPRDNFARPTVFPFGGTNEQPDFSTLSVEYFQRLDRVIEHLNRKQIVAHLMIYVWNKQVNWPDPESKADNRYFDYVAKRYQAYPNLVWDISKEALDYGRDDMGYITRRIDRLRRLDGHGRLLTVHDYKYCQAFPGKVDFISIQEWEPYLYYRMVRVRRAHPRKPVFNIEHGAYEKTTYSIFDGAYTDPETCLDRTYQCFFAGTYATYYWQNSSWYNVIVDPFSLPQEQQPHFRYYRHLVELLKRFDFTKLKASQQTFVPPLLSDGDAVFLFYLSEGRTGIYGRVDALAGKRMNLRWFDPLTGAMIEDGTRDFGESTWLGIRRPESITGPTCVAVLTDESG